MTLKYIPLYSMGLAQTCQTKPFEVRVKFIGFILNLQIQFQALHFCFLLLNQNLVVNLCATKSGH